ncbi:hypothetical protein GGTG_13768 [Gaeumannomyces tritici R3-111a-1]|uniref:Calpain catalytic domain-containing protein n=1 Tax=Gaeumannomyces tritici (strain R3-111a-1) TaxID=644352 RepID=J3PJS9_GAET3|nr:hypothetical protein GGTG_13768 [Gaeumannomyces tritici R3-111a-1]EJT68663.1 hypothetical protein GGTG_13768 [Gaeumannomyces tritici R3-111a-1]
MADPFGNGEGEWDGIVEGHAYYVTKTTTTGDNIKVVLLRNPWGTGQGDWKGPYSDGSKEWTPELQTELQHSFSSNSGSWISYDDMLSKFQYIGRTRLFREDDWRCSRCWIGVDVPWHTQWQEKFHMRLTRDSPLIVLALSQLDSRYFRGLEGQDVFKLRLRVLKQGASNPEDYVACSRTSFIERTANVEILDMAAGNYSIWIMVKAYRQSGQKSVTDVVENECRNIGDNEKLEKVGRAYDLAHAKAAWYQQELAKRRGHGKREVEREAAAESAEKEAIKKDAKAEKAKGEQAPGEVEASEKPRPESWDKMCVMGLRVYNKDEGLKLRAVIDGEVLDDCGMGDKGTTDVDDAQACAGDDPGAGGDGGLMYALGRILATLWKFIIGACLKEWSG